MSISVLMYHHVLENDGTIAISQKNFEAQMKMLAKGGYTTITPDELLAYKQGKITLPKKSVLITFDDGWRNNYIYAYPILKKYGLKATIFLITSWMNIFHNVCLLIVFLLMKIVYFYLLVLILC